MIREEEYRRVHVLGGDRVPRRSHATRHGDRLEVECEAREAVKVRFPFQVGPNRELMLTTCALRQGAKNDYGILPELARGTLHRLKNVAALCESAEIALGPSILAFLEEATQAFCEAVTSQHHPVEADRAARRSLEKSLSAFEEIAPIYAEASRQFVATHAPQRSFLLGVFLHDLPPVELSPLLQKTFNTGVIQPIWKNCEPTPGRYDWSHVEQPFQYCRHRDIKTVVGPILRLDHLTTPDWLYLWDNDFSELLARSTKFVEGVVRKFGGDTDFWYCASGLNHCRTLSLTDEQQLHLLLSSIETIRKQEPRTPVLVSFDLPWGEYLASSDRELAPIHFAEELVRGGIGVSGIGLEMNLGRERGTSFFRDFFEVSDLLDQWGMLGIPLFVSISVPSSWRADPHAVYPLTEPPPEDQRISRRSQRELVQKILPAVATHPSVQGLFWNQASDEGPHLYPNSGLIDVKGRSKSVVGAIEELARKYLK